MTSTEACASFHKPDQREKHFCRWQEEVFSRHCGEVCLLCGNHCHQWRHLVVGKRIVSQRDIPRPQYCHPMMKVCLLNLHENRHSCILLSFLSLFLWITKYITNRENIMLSHWKTRLCKNICHKTLQIREISDYVKYKIKTLLAETEATGRKPFIFNNSFGNKKEKTQDLVLSFFCFKLDFYFVLWMCFHLAPVVMVLLSMYLFLSLLMKIYSLFYSLSLIFILIFLLFLFILFWRIFFLWGGVTCHWTNCEPWVIKQNLRRKVIGALVFCVLHRIGLFHGK